MVTLSLYFIGIFQFSFILAHTEISGVRETLKKTQKYTLYLLIRSLVHKGQRNCYGRYFSWMATLKISWNEFIKFHQHCSFSTNSGFIRCSLVSLTLSHHNTQHRTQLNHFGKLSISTYFT